MKITKYFGFALASALMLAACQEVDDALQGSVVTDEQKSWVTLDDDSKLSGDLNNLKNILIQFGTLSDDHDDYGFPSVCLKYDQAGQDMVSENTGYNWFSYQLRFADRAKTGVDTRFIWSLHHQHIKAANDILREWTAPGVVRTSTISNYIGQAYAARAFDYLQLVQTYQFTYIGHKEELALPIITEKMSFEETMNNPLRTVSEVYERIMQDLDSAVVLLEANPLDGDKSSITAGVAYGLRARANLLMGNWEDAANDAASALEVSGATPYSIAEVSVPSFNEASTNSWIWGCVITSNNDVVQTGIINWPSHLCSLTGNGYTTGIGSSDCYKRINSELYNRIPDTDVRKGWWLDANMSSPLLVNEYGAAYASILPSYLVMAPYTNVKFGNQGDLLDADNSEDWPMMRAEEMYLIYAEALGRLDVNQGKAFLEQYIKAFRDPAYTCQAADLDAFIDEIWFQRRVELWGEGFSLFDVLRLKKPIVRSGANFSSNVTYNDLPAESPIFIYSIPEKEYEANKGIDVSLLREDPVPPTANM